ncbi:MAG: tRNA adenosine(34) deaminase TadA [Microcystaceae cyanobacterium]
MLVGYEAFAPEVYARHCAWMALALQQAELAGHQGEIPVGAVLVNGINQEILAIAHNRKEETKDPTAHAEILAIRKASQRLKTWHLEDCHLYVTLEPCPMCAGAIVHARLGLLVYGADDPKTGAIRSVLNLPDSRASNHHLTAIGGVLESDCRQRLQNWFQQKRSSQPP